MTFYEEAQQHRQEELNRILDALEYRIAHGEFNQGVVPPANPRPGDLRGVSYRERLRREREAYRLSAGRLR